MHVCNGRLLSGSKIYDAMEMMVGISVIIVMGIYVGNLLPELGFISEGSIAMVTSINASSLAVTTADTMWGRFSLVRLYLYYIEQCLTMNPK